MRRVRTITSLQNAKVKNVAKLRKRAFRDAQRLTVVEGGHEVDLALSASVTPHQVFVCRSLLDNASISPASRCEAMYASGQTSLYEVTPQVYARMAYREDSGGLLAVMPYFGRKLQDVALSQSALVLVVEGAEKPGNLGAILRTGDAAGADLVIACGAGTDLYNPNVVRASLGCVFTVPTFQTDAADAIEWLHQSGCLIVAASPDASKDCFHIDMRGKTAIALGSEAHGLTETWSSAADQRVRIPMFGSVDSLNLSASAAILLYEAVRQRHSLN